MGVRMSEKYKSIGGFSCYVIAMLVAYKSSFDKRESKSFALYNRSFPAYMKRQLNLIGYKRVMISLHWWSYITPRSPEYDVRQEEIETTFLRCLWVF